MYEIFDEDLPYVGVAIDKLLTEVNEKIISNSSNVGRPSIIAWMNNAGFLGDKITVTAYDMPGNTGSLGNTL